MGEKIERKQIKCSGCWPLKGMEVFLIMCFPEKGESSWELLLQFDMHGITVTEISLDTVLGTASEDLKSAGLASQKLTAEIAFDPDKAAVWLEEHLVEGATLYCNAGEYPTVLDPVVNVTFERKGFTSGATITKKTAGQLFYFPES